MAIGSAPEIGTQFTMWGKMDEAARAAWFDHIKANWGPDLVGGYGTLITKEIFMPQKGIPVVLNYDFTTFIGRGEMDGDELVIRINEPRVIEELTVKAISLDIHPSVMPDTGLCCVYPACAKIREKDAWCTAHWGLYPHKCCDYDCDRTVQFNDEPYCYTHSPDSGSSERGYSAYLAAGKG